MYATESSGVISSSSLVDQCDSDSICIIPTGLVLDMDQSLSVGALVVRGSLRWNEATTAGQTIYLCAGYVAVEGNGFFLMNIQQLEQTAWLYINHNGAEHPKLRTRAFGGVADSTSGGNPTINI